MLEKINFSDKTNINAIQEQSLNRVMWQTWEGGQPEFVLIIDGGTGERILAPKDSIAIDLPEKEIKSSF